MNEKFDMHFLNKLLKVGGTLLITAFIIWVFKEIGILSLLQKVFWGLFPVILAISLAYILEPIIRKMDKVGIKRPFAVIITYLILGGFIFLIFYFLIPNILGQLQEFFTNLPQIIESMESVLDKFTNALGIKINLDQIIEQSLSSMTNSLISGIKGIASTVMGVAIAITGAVFLSFDFPAFRKTVRNLVKKAGNNRFNRFLVEFLPSIHRYTIGLLIDNMIFFIIATTVFFLVGAKFPFLFGLIIALTNFIPLVGQFIGGIPIILIGFSRSVNCGIIYLIIIVILQFFESNVMQPIMVRSTLKIRPIENLIGVAICGQLFGLIGMVIAPFFVMAVKILWQQNTKNEEVKEKDPIEKKAQL